MMAGMLLCRAGLAWLSVFSLDAPFFILLYCQESKVVVDLLFVLLHPYLSLIQMFEF